ncbi:MAG: DUF5856 family protein [Tannerellaceae bacterium]|nr:DUF5856 family protein [Tannerellaceae bacterium]
MATTVKSAQSKSSTQQSNNEMGQIIGQMFAFNTTLKLYHWHVTGAGSYAQHIALDQALETLPDVLDRLTETTYALNGDITISVPEANVPGDIIKYASDFYKYIESHRDVFSATFSDSIIDDYQEAVQQLLYRLIRLK